MMTTNLVVIANVKKKCEPAVVLEIYCPFFRTSWGVGVLNSAVFDSFHNRLEFGTILEGLRNFGGGVFEPPIPPSVRHWRKVFGPKVEEVAGCRSSVICTSHGVSCG